MLFSLDLAFARLCLAQSKIYMPVGGQVADRGVRLFGKWFPCVLCGAFGGSVMIGVLRTSQGLLKSCSICSSVPYSLGLWGG
jgi:hypothetical protein